MSKQLPTASLSGGEPVGSRLIRPRRLHTLLLLALTVLYALVFPAMHRTLGEGSTALSMLLTAAASWSFGLWPGLGCSVGVVVLNLVLLWGVHGSIPEIMARGGAVGFVVLVMSGALIGYLSDLRRRLAWGSSVKQALVELSTALVAGGMNIDEISDIALAHAQRITDSPYGLVGYVDERSGHLVAHRFTPAIWGECQVSGKSTDFGHFAGLWGWVLEHRQPLLTNHPAGDARSSGAPNGHVPIRRFLCAPALVAGNLIGEIALANASRDYTTRDLAALERLMDLYAAGIAQWRSQQALRNSEDRFRRMFEESPTAVMLFGAQGELLGANPSALKRFGVAEVEDLSGIPFFDNPWINAEQRQQVLEGQTVRAESAFDFGDVRERFGRPTTRTGVVQLAWTISPLEGKRGYLLQTDDISERIRAAEEREKLVAQLQDTLANVKTLRGLVPICANCKKIRDDQGYWHAVELYVREHSEAEFTHGICPDCMRKLYGDLLDAAAPDSQPLDAAAPPKPN